MQLDTCKIALGCYQYTALNDCTRYRVLAVFARRTAASTRAFLERVIEEMLFPVLPPLVGATRVATAPAF